MNNKKERIVVKKLAAKLRERNTFFNKSDPQHLGDILDHVTPAKSKKVRAILKELYVGITPPLQPDVDIFFRKKNDIRAMEVKIFHKDKGSLNRSYYEGIDQALALLTLGFDNVTLWHIFAQDIEPRIIARYGSLCQIFIREQLKLPIDFTTLQMTIKDEEYDFVPIKPIVKDPKTLELHDIKFLKKINDPTFTFIWQTKNPLLKYDLVKKIRKAMLDWTENR
ncbi:hypothetical protein ACFLQ6_07965 [Thermoproteota archaeon]